MTSPAITSASNTFKIGTFFKSFFKYISGKEKIAPINTGKSGRRKIKKTTKVDYVFVDYIQLLNCDVKVRDALLKELTISLNIPFVVSSQLPRNYNEMNIGLEKQEYTKIFIIKDFNEYEIL